MSKEARIEAAKKIPVIMAREIMVTIMEITKIKNKFTKAIVN